MRTRTKTGQNCPIIVVNCKDWGPETGSTPRSKTQNPTRYNASYYFDWTVPNGFKTSFETMQDDTGTDGAFRNVNHIFETNEFSAPHKESIFPYSWQTSQAVRSVTTSDITNTHLVRDASGISMQDMADEAMAFMLPRLNENTSLVNTLLEMKDLKRMDPAGSVDRILSRRNTLRMLYKSKGERQFFVKELTTRLNNAHLNASFGIVPFVRDIVGISDDLMGLAAKLRLLRQEADTRLQRHYKRVIPASAGTPHTRMWVQGAPYTRNWVAGPRTNMNTNGGVRFPIRFQTRGRWIVRPVYHATLRYSYSLPSIQSQLANIAAYLDVLGVRLDPSIVWNAIPFSFLVDWVVDVSGFLGHFARNNFDINTIVHDFCHSYKWHKECELTLSFDGEIPANMPDVRYPNTERNCQPYVVYSGTRKSYVRSVLRTHNIPSITARAPKLRQAALAGSLLLSRSAIGRANNYLNLRYLK